MRSPLLSSVLHTVLRYRLSRRRFVLMLLVVFSGVVFGAVGEPGQKDLLELAHSVCHVIVNFQP